MTSINNLVLVDQKAQLWLDFLYGGSPCEYKKRKESSTCYILGTTIMDVRLRFVDYGVWAYNASRYSFSTDGNATSTYETRIAFNVGLPNKHVFDTTSPKNHTNIPCCFINITPLYTI